MIKPNYGGVIEPWKMKLLLSRARHLGFRKDELDDVQQELILDLIHFHYTPERSNGASEKTVLRAVIDKRLCKLIRFRYRYQRHLEKYKWMQRLFSREEVSPRVIDMNGVIATLSESQQTVSRYLAAGLNKNEIALKMDLDWHTVDRCIQRIREAFVKAGLGRAE
jgi:DNA-directed RNA polymerase specialized sigma24 family protein